MREHGSTKGPRGAEGGFASGGATPGKRTLTQSLPIQRKAQGAPRSGADPQALMDDATRGTATEVPFRAEMERALGADLGGVSAHLGRRSELSGLGAVAATRGDEVAFAESSPPRDVVAHELAHVVQNQRGGAATGGGLSQPGDAAEREAASVADRIAGGGHAAVTGASGGAIQRQLTEAMKLCLEEIQKAKGDEAAEKLRKKIIEIAQGAKPEDAKDFGTAISNLDTDKLDGSVGDVIMDFQFNWNDLIAPDKQKEKDQHEKKDDERKVEVKPKVDLSKWAESDDDEEEVVVKQKRKLNAKGIDSPGRQQLLVEVQNSANLLAKSSEDELPLEAIGQWVDLLDLLVQFVNDVVAESGLGDVGAPIKALVTEAAVQANKAYLLLAHDPKAVKTALPWIVFAAKSILLVDKNKLGALLDKAPKAVPKAREQNRRIDVGALMLARSVLSTEKQAPDLVVGLPTGGTHVANRTAASFSLMTGEKQEPLAWNTRPTAVKKESQEFMKNVSKDNILQKAELQYLADALSKRGVKKGNKLRIFIVDDGMKEGGTLKIARDLYEEAFGSLGYEVVVTTGVAMTGIVDKAEPDYVVNPEQDLAGPKPLHQDLPKEVTTSMSKQNKGASAHQSAEPDDLSVGILRKQESDTVVDVFQVHDLLSGKVTDSVKIEHK